MLLLRGSPVSPPRLRATRASYVAPLGTKIVRRPRQARELHRVGGSRTRPALFQSDAHQPEQGTGHALQLANYGPIAAAPAGELGQLDLVVLPWTPHYHPAHAEGPEYDRANAGNVALHHSP